MDGKSRVEDMTQSSTVWIQHGELSQQKSILGFAHSFHLIFALKSHRHCAVFQGVTGSLLLLVILPSPALFFTETAFLLD